MTVRTIDDIFRDFVIEGMPASGPFNPYKPDIRDTLKKLLEGLSTFPDNRVIRLNNANEGTANNIVVSSSVAIPSAAYQVLYVLNVTQANTGAVTVSGAINRALVTNTSQPVPNGYLKPGMAVLCIDTGSTLRMLSYGNERIIVEEAEQALAEAIAARDQARDAANDAVSQGNVPIYATKTAVEGYEVPEGIHAIRLNGWTDILDGQGGLFVDEPNGSSIGFLSGDGRTWYKSEDISPSRIKSGQETQFQIKLGLRWRLKADANYYVRSDGNDSNSGLLNTAGGAFKTISRAKEAVYNDLDLNNFTAYVHIASGVYDEQIYCAGSVVGHNNNNVGVIFRGTGASRNDVIVRRGFTAVGGARIRVTGIRLDPAGAAYTCLYCFDTGSAITASDITFGQSGPAGSSSNDHMYASDGGYIRMGAPYSIEGGALNHLHATEYAMIRVDGQVVPVVGNPSFDGQFAGVASSTLFTIGVTYSGSATGRTYLVHYNGVIRSNQSTRNVFPGNIVGVEQSGGRLDNAPMVRAGRSGASLTIENGAWRHVTPLNATIDIGGEFASSDAGARARGGHVMIIGQVTFEAFNAPNELIGVSIYKNGVEFAAALDTSNDSTTSNQNRKTVSVMALDTVNVANAGGDIYQLYARGGDTGSSIIHGSPSWTSLMMRQF